MKIINYSFIALVLLSACKGQPDKQKTQQETKQEQKPVAVNDTALTLTAEQFKNAGLEIGKPEVHTMHTTLRANGTVDVPPENVHSISFPMGGYVKNAKLIPGMQLRKGQVIATLEDQAFIQLQQDYLTARAKLTFDKADYDRQTTLNKTQSNSQRVYQQAVSEYESQKVLLKGLAEKLRLIGINPDKLTEGNLSRTVNIYAPISGYVSKVNVNRGKYISPTDVLFELIDPSELHADLQVFENDARALRQGQTVVCTPTNNPGIKIGTRIEYITHNIDENRAVEVHCHLDKPASGLLPGNFITGEIQLNNQSANAIPDDGVVKWQGKNYVFVTADSKTFSLVPVTTGASADGYTEIKSILPTDGVVSKNAYALLTMLKNKAED